MLDIHIKDWGKNRPKKHYNNLHQLRIFELIFSNKLAKLGVEINNISIISIYLLADPKKNVSHKEDLSLGEISIFLPDDYMDFLKLSSNEDKFQAFSKVIINCVVPCLEKHCAQPFDILIGYVQEALNEIIHQNYEGIFLVGKTPKKSPSRKQIAILKGIHRSEGFQLRCEVYDAKGLKIIDQLLVKEVGHEVVYSRFLGTLKWENEYLITVKSKTSSWMKEIHIPQ
ncbi:hypothetical protein [Pseudobacillus wudalianchiensis]|uniref:Uncharacterized protein n=1 Tax=Pseudobacillus wudalianchiensis TaxID=1743143 RepID=A0A1B9B925_9BACI|nr:hypothetical protein [Bacillus wudalianchiensis]OCA92583.1 hypothetical protein A8F95_02485 [Bacillus wudalianchiensis]